MGDALLSLLLWSRVFVFPFRSVDTVLLYLTLLEAKWGLYFCLHLFRVRCFDSGCVWHLQVLVSGFFLFLVHTIITFSYTGLTVYLQPPSLLYAT